MASTAGQVYENPVTGERGVILAGDDEDRDARMVVELTVAPGGAVAAAHSHSYIHETFEVLEGEVGFLLDGERSVGGPGTKVEIPVGAVHDWWNAGQGKARVIVTVDPVGRFDEMIKTLFGLARDGKTNDKGMPNLLQLAVFAKEFRPEMELTRPPRVVQTLLFGILSPIGKALGYRATYPEYEAPHGHVEVPADLRHLSSNQA
jgi:quercetin dioxygenase-like cupin family protein